MLLLKRRHVRGKVDPSKDVHMSTHINKPAGFKSGIRLTTWWLMVVSKVDSKLGYNYNQALKFHIDTRHLHDVKGCDKFWGM